MDFPKSVPGVGLVNGEFVDEDTALGQQGSLIPAEWGNAVTKELVAVIEEDGQVPSESVLTQLRDALYGAVSSAKRRLLRIASSADMQDSNCDDAAVTPKELRAGFSGSFGAQGFVAFPSWLGGIILQWGQLLTGGAGLGSIYMTFPIAFPSALRGLVCTAGAGDGSVNVAYSEVSRTGAKVSTRNVNENVGSVNTSFFYIAVGV